MDCTCGVVLHRELAMDIPMCDPICILPMDIHMCDPICILARDIHICYPNLHPAHGHSHVCDPNGHSHL